MFGIAELMLDCLFKRKSWKASKWSASNQLFFSFCRLFLAHKQKRKVWQTLWHNFQELISSAKHAHNDIEIINFLLLLIFLFTPYAMKESKTNYLCCIFLLLNWWTTYGLLCEFSFSCHGNAWLIVQVWMPFRLLSSQRGIERNVTLYYEPFHYEPFLFLPFSTNEGIAVFFFLISRLFSNFTGLWMDFI